MNTRQRISDFQHHVNSHAVEIRKAADDAWSKINLAQPEPQIIYDFLKDTKGGTGYLNRELGKLLSVGGRIVKFASIFLHQKPKVKGVIGRTSNAKGIGGVCELGDLQLLFLYISANKAICQCRSTIFQAKIKPSTGSHVIDHLDQRRLYDQCFGFVYQTVLTGEQRCLPWGKPERERALQYLFIGQRPIQSRLIPSDQNQGAFVDFGELILRFLNDSTGYGVTARPSAGRNWSRIVLDQIDNVAKTAFGHQGDRNSALKSILNQFNNFDDPKEFFLEVPPSEATESAGGIPMLLIIVSDGELGPEKVLQQQAHNDITGERRSKKPLSPTPISVTVKKPTTTGETEEKNNLSNKQDLHSANMDDLLLSLEASAPKEQHDIVLELRRRSNNHMLPQYHANKILNVLKRIHGLDQKTMSMVWELQRTLHPKETEKVKVYHSS